MAKILKLAAVGRSREDLARDQANREPGPLQPRAERLAFPIWSYLSCYPAPYMASPRCGRISLPCASMTRKDSRSPGSVG